MPFSLRYCYKISFYYASRTFCFHFVFLNRIIRYNFPVKLFRNNDLNTLCFKSSIQERYSLFVVALLLGYQVRNNARAASH